MKALDFNQQSAKAACQTLLNKADALADQSGERAKKTNDEIFQILHSLYIACDKKSFEVQHLVQVKRDQYLQINQEQVNLTKAIDDQQNQLNQNQQELAKIDTNIAQLQDQLEQEKNKLKQLHDKKHELEQRRLDLAKYFWVPFYNYYLIGRTIDDAVAQIPAVEAKAKELSGYIKKWSKERDQANTQHDQHEAKLHDLNDQMQQLSAKQKNLVDQELHLSQDLAMLERASRLLTEFSDASVNAEERNRGLDRFMQLLNSDENIAQASGSLFVSYRQGIEMLGDILDKYPRLNSRAA
jgi:chromosome segregation ATPase